MSRTHNRARFHRAASTLAGSLGGRQLLDRFSNRELAALFIEERARIREAGITTWQGYRSLNRVGSTVALGGREKKAIFTALTSVGF